MFQRDFFGSDPASLTSYRQTLAQAIETMANSLPDRPFEGYEPHVLATLLDTEICPADGKDRDEVFNLLSEIVKGSVALWNPFTAAHLHCPVLIPALAAELMISALNQSMDSFDQAPAATIIEQNMIEWLCRSARLPLTASGTFTAGGTQSNFMGLLLARDHFHQMHWNWSVLKKGLHPDAHRLRILCSEVAHFSVEKSACQLGLGTEAVLQVAVDEHFRLRPDKLIEQIEALCQQGLIPMAVVATAGTTDFGSFDPLDSIAQIAAEARLWLHVDASYGGALLLSEKHRSLLDGLHYASSVSIDFHKSFFQPISCGAFLLANEAHFDLFKINADYLNSEEHERDGVPDLVTRSILTTRRFDALKLWVCLQILGAKKYAQLIDRTIELAAFVADEIKRMACFELINQPVFGCVVFRYQPTRSDIDANRINAQIPRNMFTTGTAIMGYTKVGGRNCLKLTFLNPNTQPAQFVELLQLIRRFGQEAEA